MVGRLKFREQKTRLLDYAEQIVLGKSAVERFRTEPVFASFERQHVPLVVPPIKDVDCASRIIAWNHLQKQDSFCSLNPARGDRFADFEEGCDGLLDGTDGSILPTQDLVGGHLSEARLHDEISFLEDLVWEFRLFSRGSELQG